MRFEDWEAKQMRDPEFRAATEELEPAYQVARLRIIRGLWEGENMKTYMTWKDIEEYLKTPEGQIKTASQEMQFRKGYYYAVGDVVSALGGGVTVRQLRTWLEGELFDWWNGDMTKYKKPPIIP